MLYRDPEIVPLTSKVADKEALGSDYEDGDLNCCVEDGSLWRPSVFTSAGRDLLRRRNLNSPNFHALRHSHASQLLRAGLDIKVVSERRGHAKSGFTLDTYGHLLPGRDEEAANRIDRTLRAAIEKQRRPVAWRMGSGFRGCAIDGQNSSNFGVQPLVGSC